MPVKNITDESNNKMEKVIEHLHEEFKGLRTGCANTGLVENIKAECYGSMMPLKQLATLAAPQPDMIIIKPFDPSCVKEIEKAIKNSDLSIAPMVEGKMIRLSIPPLSKERRQGLVNQAKHSGEQAKIIIRNIRRDAIKELEKKEKDKVITEDDLEKGKKQIDDITKSHTEKIDETVKHKSDEILKG
ncbi:MAG: ribosome recycling factor [Sedimentisphaerales bacterium]|nr:ribosome recycling factor [Sedimentisphaerales bacterium]